MARPKLDRMRLGCVARWSAAAAAVLACVACGRDEQPRGDSAVDTSAIPQAAVAAPEDWAGELGQLFVVPSDTDNAAVVIFPDFPSARLIASAPITLVNVSGDTLRARAQLVATESEQCGGAPLVELRDTVTGAWTVGLLGRSVATLRADSIEGMPPADSAKLAADLARIASGLTANQESRFSGLPFAVLSAHRVDEAERQTVVAHLVRRLPQEASPLEEHMLIIADRPKAPANAGWKVSHTERSEGSEDTAEHFQLLAAVRAPDRVMLILARDQLERTRYEILERQALGPWRSRWSRTLVC
jgi:hypothetical protein